MNGSQIISGLIVLSFYFGVTLKRKPLLHRNWMLSTMLVDLILVLYLVMARSAVNTAVEYGMQQSMPLILMVHITLAVLSIVGYVFAIILGRGVLQGQRQLLTKHRMNAYALLILRTLTFITAFFIPLK